MVITVNSGKGNLANYLINGNNNSRDKEKITILEGNAKLTDSLSKSIDADDKHFHFILSAHGKRSDTDMREIYDDFKKELLHAYSDVEVNLLSVLHQDTENSHIHIQVPKRNLLTNTKLDLYFHKRDMKRFEMIRDYLNLKYHEAPPSPNATSNPTKNWAYNPQSIKNKLEKKAFENKFLDYLFENKEQFNSHEELMQHITEDLGIKYNKVGYDYKKDDFYITIQHQEGLKAQRIFSPLFNDGKSKYITNEDGEKQYIKYNFQNTPIEKQKQHRHQESLQKLRERLDSMQGKYSNYIEKRIGSAREKANKKIENIRIEPLQPQEPINTEQKTLSDKDIQKESYIKNTALIYQTIEQFRKINLADIASKLFHYKQIDKGEFHTLIEHPKTAQQLLVYKDKEKDEYRFRGLNNLKIDGDIGKLLEMNIYSIHAHAIQLLHPIRMMVGIYKDLKKLGKIGLDALVKHLQQKRCTHKEEKRKPSLFSKDTNMPTLSKDLKPK